MTDEEKRLDSAELDRNCVGTTISDLPGRFFQWCRKVQG